MHAVLARLVLSLVLVVPLWLTHVAESLELPAAYVVLVNMASTTADTLQVFEDSGRGFTETLAASTTTVASTSAREYRLPIPLGRYFHLRIDPANAPGTYVLERVAILDRHGQVRAELPLRELQPIHDLIEVQRHDSRLVVECRTPGADPQLLYKFPSPLVLDAGLEPLHLGYWLIVGLVIAFAFVWILERAFGRVAPQVQHMISVVRVRATRYPNVAIMIVALITTTAATYPVLLFGRSFVSPNNGGTMFLYPRPPYTPGSDDRQIEDIRGADVGAMMWAFVPYSRVQRNALADGEWPLWNRYNSTGVSLWGQGQSFFLDPLHWLTLVGPDLALGWDLKFVAHRYLLSWGVGAAAFVATGSWVPAAIVAACAPFLGFYAFRFNHPAIFVLTYAPWVLTGWFLLVRASTWRDRTRASLLIAVASALVLVASPPKEAVVMLAALELAGVLTLALGYRSRHQALQSLGAAVLAGTVAILLTTPQWMMFIDTLRLGSTVYDTIRGVGLAGPEFGAAMVLGPLVGTPSPGLHLVSCVLVLAAVASRSVWRQQPAAAACLLVASCVLGLAYGVVPSEWLVRVPFVANIRWVHVTFTNAAVILLLVASASGAAALLTGIRPSILVATIGILFAGTLACLADSSRLMPLAQVRGWLALTAVGLAALLPLSLAVAARTSPRVLPATAVGALALLLLLPGGQHVETGLGPMDAVLQQPRLRHKFEARSPVVDLVHAQMREPVRTVGVDDWLFPGAQALYDLEGTGGGDAVFLQTTWELQDTPDSSVRTDWWRLFMRMDLARDATLLDMLNVGYLLAPVDAARELGPPEVTPSGNEPAPFRRPTAWPRAYFVDRVETYSTPNDLLARARGIGHPIAAMQLGDVAASELVRKVSGGSGVVLPADRYELTTNVTRFHVRTPSAGVAVLAESYMPDDFVATLNGRPVPYCRLNHAFKGVAIPEAGDWEVRFEYRPRRWNLALGAAGLGALMLVGLAASACGVGVRRRHAYNENPAALASS